MTEEEDTFGDCPTCRARFFVLHSTGEGAAPASARLMEWARSIAAGDFANRPDYLAIWAVQFAKKIVEQGAEIARLKNERDRDHDQEAWLSSTT